MTQETPNEKDVTKWAKMVTLFCQALALPVRALALGIGNSVVAGYTVLGICVIIGFAVFGAAISTPAQGWVATWEPLVQAEAQRSEVALAKAAETAQYKPLGGFTGAVAHATTTGITLQFPKVPNATTYTVRWAELTDSRSGVVVKDATYSTHTDPNIFECEITSSEFGTSWANGARIQISLFASNGRVTARYPYTLFADIKLP